MSAGRVVFDQVWKKFRRGERHDSLRDLIPSVTTGLFRKKDHSQLAKEEFWALKDVSFEVGPGETLGIIGRNGAGKSTTLKLLTRILKPTRGRSEVRGRVGALIELAAGFHPDLTGRENVFLQGAIMGMRRHEIERRFAEIVEFAGIGPFIDTQVKRYSSGMQARLGFSVAAHLEPDVLLIDEVLAVGDLSFQQKCYDRLREFRKQGVAIAFVSHNMQAISMLCDRVLYLQPGGPPKSGPVGEMVSAYVTTDAMSADPRLSTRASLAVADSGETALAPVPPGTWLSLRLVIEATVDFSSAGLSLLVHRADGLLVFDGNSMLDGERPFDLGPARPWALTVTFRANLLRGTYAISGLLVEEQRRWPTVHLGILGSFVVAETTRSGGIADLEPRYQTSTPVTA